MCFCIFNHFKKRDPLVCSILGELFPGESRTIRFLWGYSTSAAEREALINKYRQGAPARPPKQGNSRRLQYVSQRPTHLRTHIRSSPIYTQPFPTMLKQIKAPALGMTTTNRVLVCSARSLNATGQIPRHSIAAVRALKSGLWATAGGKGARNTILSRRMSS